LTVDGKATEARFFLDKLASCDPTDNDSVHYLSAFLSASRSIMNQLLREYAKSYDMGVGDDDALDAKSFRSRAQSMEIQGALRFIDAYDQSIEKLKRNEYYNVLALRRNINVNHGLDPTLLSLSIMTQETIDGADTLTVRHRREPPIAVSPVIPHRVLPELETRASKGFWFEGFPDESVARVCEVYLRAILDEVGALRAVR
jgi:hypothetical protein